MNQIAQGLPPSFGSAPNVGSQVSSLMAPGASSQQFSPQQIGGQLNGLMQQQTPPTQQNMQSFANIVGQPQLQNYSQPTSQMQNQQPQGQVQQQQYTPNYQDLLQQLQQLPGMQSNLAALQSQLSGLQIPSNGLQQIYNQYPNTGGDQATAIMQANSNYSQQMQNYNSQQAALNQQIAQQQKAINAINSQTQAGQQQAKTQ